MQTKSIITTAIAVTMALTPMLAAHAATNPSSLNSTVQTLVNQQRQAISNTVKSVVNVVSANTTERTSITLNGTPFSQPYRIVSGGTTYMPIYYVDKALQSLGFTATWNGTVHTWTLANGNSAPSLSINGKTGNTTIRVNGSNVEQNVPIIQAKDPASGVVTTFMPIWYVQQILNSMGFGTDTWNGASTPPTWTLSEAGSAGTTSATPPAPPSTSTTTSAPTTANAVSASTDPTAAQVAQGLLGVYATQQVWPWLLDMGLGWSPSSYNPTTYPQSPTNAQWYGLATVFPGKPASDYAQLQGMTSAPQDQPITAGTLAQWLYNWEKYARIPHEEWNTLVNQPSTDPYTLMKDYSMFYGTDFTSANSVVTAQDLSMVEKNIVSVDQCYRVLAPNKIQVLVPMIYANGIATPAKTKSMILSADSVIFPFPGHNQLVATASVNTFNMGISGTYIPSINKGLITSVQYPLKPNQPVTLVAGLGKSYVLHSGAANLKTMPMVMLMPSYLNDNSPIFEVSIGPFAAASYYITFQNGQFSRIYVSGSQPTDRYKLFNSNWPIEESSRFAG